jgi:hypothetical protein
MLLSHSELSGLFRQRRFTRMCRRVTGDAVIRCAGTGAGSYSIAFYIILATALLVSLGHLYGTPALYGYRSAFCGLPRHHASKYLRSKRAVPESIAGEAQ